MHEKPLDSNMYLIRGSGTFISIWEKVIIVLAVYNSFMIPWQLFFRDLGLSLFWSNQIQLLDAVIDLIFIIDIVINFRTTYLDTNLSEEVTDSTQIAYRYVLVSGAFWIDFASSFPFVALFTFEEDSDSSL